MSENHINKLTIEQIFDYLIEKALKDTEKYSKEKYYLAYCYYDSLLNLKSLYKSTQEDLNNPYKEG